MMSALTLLVIVALSATNLVGYATAAWRKPGDGFLRRAKVEKRVLPTYPKSRFTDWDSLDTVTEKQAKDILGYDKKKWNIPGQLELEELSFETINITSFEMLDVVVQKNKDAPLTPIQVITQTLNITEDSWDCYLNHYRDYFWAELVEYEVVAYVKALGWDEKAWEENKKAPKSEEREWFELSQVEKDAAEALCYFPELWAEDIEISLWTHQPEEIESENTGGTDNINTTTSGNDTERPFISPWNLPEARFVLWDNLTESQEKHAVTLGYNETTWNSPGTAEIELNFTSFEDLTPGQKGAAKALGFDKFYWDCIIQHYSQYAWNDLAALGVKAFWETLGWTFASWHGILPPPAAATMAYDQLSPEQQNAADQLCYLPETYGGGNLAEIDLTSLTAPPATTAP